MFTRTTALRAAKLGTVAPIALIAALAAPAASGTLDDDVLIGTSGDGLIFSDPEEGVLPPGIRGVTFTSTRIENPDFDPATDPESERFLYVDPFTNYIWDYTDVDGDGTADDPLANRGTAPNCLIANNADVFCDSARGSGKRIKIWQTGPGSFDMILATTPGGIIPAEPDALPLGITEVDTSLVDYFNFGKVSNFTGARITGYAIQILDIDGNLMSTRDAADAVLFNLDPDVIANLGNGARIVDGLFGAGGNEGDIGFFDGPDPATDRAPFVISRADAELLFGAAIDPATGLINNPDYIADFSDAMLDNSMIPDGIFWDDNADPTDEGKLLAWFDYRENGGDGGWVWGNLAVDPAPVLADLAADLGVDVADLDYTAGNLVPADIVALIEGDSAFESAPIEDLRNANINYTITVGNVEEGQFIIRMTPTFAPIVEAAGSDLQFAVAGALDAANVPYLNADPAYLTLISRIEGLSPAEQQLALQTIGHDFLGSFAGLSYGLGSGALMALGTGGVDDGMDVSSRGTGRWTMGEGLTGFVEITGSSADQDATAGGAAYSTSTLGVHGGLEYGLSPEWSAGFMLSGVNGDADIAGNRGTVDADGYGFTGFARYNGAVGGGDLNVRMALGMQSLSYDTTRNIFIGAVTETATGSTDGETIYAGVAADWMIGTGPLRYGPMASLEYYDISIDGYTETATDPLLALAVQDFDTDLFLGRVGVQGEYTSTTASGDQLALAGHLAYASRSGGDGNALTGFAGSNLPGFAAPLGSMDNDWLDLGAEVAMTLGGGNSRVGMEYRGALSGDGYEDHSVGVFFEMAF